MTVRAVVLSTAVLLLVLAGPRASAGDAPSTSTSTTQPDVPAQDIIPRPNSGVAPEDAGDRGGAGQLLVLAAIVVALGTIIVLAYRGATRRRAPGITDRTR